MADRSLLVLGASRYQMDTIRGAKRLGLRVVTTDNVAGNPGHALADAAHGVDTTDVEGVVALARAERIEGVVAPCTDVAVPTAACVAEALGLVGPTCAAASVLTDKAQFRAFQRAEGLACPDYVPIDAESELDPALFDAGAWLLKPDRSSGSKGIFIVSDADELAAHQDETLSFSPTGQGVVERYLAGHQGTCECLLKDGQVRWANVTTRLTVAPPHTATLAHLCPSSIGSDERRRVLADIEAACTALGLSDGPLDCDFVLTADGPVILEMSPRVGGNSLQQLTLASHDFDLAEYGVRYAMGDAPSLPDDRPGRPSAMVILGVPQAGTLVIDDHKLAELRAEAWVSHVAVDVCEGTSVPAFTDGRARIGEALLVADNHETVEAGVQMLIEQPFFSAR